MYTCIYWLKGDKNIEGKVLEAGLDNISITVITECELFYGAFKSSKVEKNLKVIADLSKKIKIVQTMDGVSRIYGKILSHIPTKKFGHIRSIINFRFSKKILR